ncbi:hypothetical protein [Brevibacillus nitrificans]|nr:hypothetical protein [Brevibacillus nitrificans]MDR7314720.1 hypothetical protein [Brevibacillus nitrificans]
MKKFLPWGPFYGVLVKVDIPDETNAWLLQDAGMAKVNPEKLGIKKKE